MSTMQALKQNIQITLADTRTDVFEELLKGSESQWWPRNMVMGFTNLSQSTEKGTLYWQKARFPLGPGWHKRNSVVDRDRKYLRRDFLDGMFQGGYEEFFVHHNTAAVEIVYRFCYQLKNPVARLLWEIAFKKMHMKALDKILGALKCYCEAKQ